MKKSKTAEKQRSDGIFIRSKSACETDSLSDED